MLKRGELKFVINGKTEQKWWVVVTGKDTTWELFILTKIRPYFFRDSVLQEI